MWGRGVCGSGGHCAHQRQRGACTCGRVASGGGEGGEALRRAALGVGRRARGRASGEEVVGVGGGEGVVTRDTKPGTNTTRGGRLYDFCRMDFGDRY